MKRITLFLALFFASPLILAQNSFAPDRPGFGYSSGTTAPGMFGLEAGITHSKFGTNLGEFFFRTGLTDAFEIQFEAGSIFVEDGETYRSAQYLILKHKLYNSTSGSFQLSVLNRTSLPFLNEKVTEYFSQIYMLADYSFTPELSLNANIGYGNYIFSDFDNAQLYFTLNPGYVITPGTSIYLGLGHTESEFFSNTDFEFGIAHLIHANSQIDIGMVFDSNSNPYLKAGIATRF